MENRPKTSHNYYTILSGRDWGHDYQKYFKIRCSDVIILVQFGSKLGQQMQLISFTSEVCSFLVQTSVGHFHYM